MRLRWSSLDISVSNIRTGMPLDATCMATLSAKTLFPTFGLAETRSTHFLRSPPPIDVSNLVNPVGIPTMSHWLSLRKVTYSLASSPILLGFSPPSSSLKKSMTGVSTIDSISSTDSVPVTVSASLLIFPTSDFILRANSNFLS